MRHTPTKRQQAFPPWVANPLKTRIFVFMRRIVPHILPLLFLVLTAVPVQAQLFVGPNFGPIPGRTLDLGILAYPKNEDWLAISLSGGTTLQGPMYFPRKKAECLSGFRNGGWHIRAGARNGFTIDHHANHLWWGLDLIYSRQKESAVFHTCDTATVNPERISQNIGVLSGAINFGYTWNPMKKKTIYQRFLVDFGLRVGYPFWSSAPLLGERDYISGLGFTWLPIRSITFEPMVTIRWELFHGRYGFFKGKTRTRFK